MLEIATEALRSASIETLRAGLIRLLVTSDSAQRDSRDLIVTFAVFYDCAERLGHDATAFFDDVADHSPARFADLLHTFGARVDITPSAFGFTVKDTSVGPGYAWDGSW